MEGVSECSVGTLQTEAWGSLSEEGTSEPRQEREEEQPETLMHREGVP